MKQGEVWRISHSRKGEFTVRILSDLADEFVDLEVVAGKAGFLSQENRMVGAGEIGSKFSSRVSFITPLELVEPATPPAVEDMK